MQVERARHGLAAVIGYHHLVAQGFEQRLEGVTTVEVVLGHENHRTGSGSTVHGDDCDTWVRMAYATAGSGGAVARAEPHTFPAGAGIRKGTQGRCKSHAEHHPPGTQRRYAVR